MKDVIHQLLAVDSSQTSLIIYPAISGICRGGVCLCERPRGTHMYPLQEGWLSQNMPLCSIPPWLRPSWRPSNMTRRYRFCSHEGLWTRSGHTDGWCPRWQGWGLQPPHISV